MSPKDWNPETAALVQAAQHLCWLCIEHAGLSEPEDLEAVRGVERAMIALGWEGRRVTDDDEEGP